MVHGANARIPVDRSRRPTPTHRSGTIFTPSQSCIGSRSGVTSNVALVGRQAVARRDASDELPDPSSEAPVSSSPLIRVSVIFAVLLLATGCRSGAPIGSIDPGPSIRSSSDVLRASEIGSARVNDAHEAIIRFRPEFLRGRAAPGLTDPSGAAPVVYLNGVRQGGSDMLRTVPVGAILEIRYLTPTVASEQFGSYYNGGVIAVRTRR